VEGNIKRLAKKRKKEEYFNKFSYRWFPFYLLTEGGTWKIPQGKKFRKLEIFFAFSQVPLFRRK
jgi:hypothetical protein